MAKVTETMDDRAEDEAALKRAYEDLGHLIEVRLGKSNLVSLALAKLRDAQEWTGKAVRDAYDRRQNRQGE